MISNTVIEIEIDQRLIRDAVLLGKRFEVRNRISVEIYRYLLLKLFAYGFFPGYSFEISYSFLNSSLMNQTSPRLAV